MTEFFAVTKTGIFEIAAPDHEFHEINGLFVQKIAIISRGNSKVGELLDHKNTLAISLWLVMYQQQGEPLDIGSIPETLWGERSSHIVGLFDDRIQAFQCLGHYELMLADPRWKQQTLETLKKIGNNPHITICQFPGLCLEERYP